MIVVVTAFHKQLSNAGSKENAFLSHLSTFSRVRLIREAFAANTTSLGTIMARAQSNDKISKHDTLCKCVLNSLGLH